MIIGDKVRLRAIERSDIPMFLRWFNDPEVRHYLTMYMPMSEAIEEKWFERQVGDTSQCIFVIETLDGTPLGNMGLININHKDANARLGITLGEKQYWGQGYGTAAVRTMLRFAFDELNLHRVELSVYDFNERAIRCYEKVGFRHEGRLRDNHFTGGRHVDELIMGILRSEFRDREEPV